MRTLEMLGAGGGAVFGSLVFLIIGLIPATVTGPGELVRIATQVGGASEPGTTSVLMGSALFWFALAAFGSMIGICLGWGADRMLPSPERSR